MNIPPPIGTPAPNPGQMPAAGYPEALPAYPGNISAYEPEALLPAHIRQRLQRRQGMRRLSRLITAVLIALALVVLLAMQLHHSDYDDARVAADNFVITLQSNDPDRAYGMGGSGFQKATTEEQLGQMLDRVEPFLKGAAIQKTDTYYATGDKGEPRAILVYTASKSGKVTYIRIVMDKQQGRWKVHSLRTSGEALAAKPE